MISGKCCTLLRQRTVGTRFSLGLLSRTFSNTTPTHSNTVYALSSGHGRCGVAVIRVSGPLCSEAVKRLCRMQLLPSKRQAVLRRLFDPTSREMIDKGLVLWFPGPNSFTGEDCAEFQVHGGTAVVAAMLEALGKLPGLQPAEPGEFTKRAFMNGKMDLTEVEGLGDLIHAETAAQRRQALRQIEGDLGSLYADWRQRILKCLANVEAFIDFSEDENIEEDTLERATAEIEKVCQELEDHLSDDRCGERLRDGIRVAIIGEPNVGKSSLMNTLCQRPAAIVSPVAGTTRDVVETTMNLAGYPVLLSDTAGLRETSDLVEREGVRRALDRATQADLKVLVLDASTVLSAKPANVSWAQFVHNHLKLVGIDRYSDTFSADSELLISNSNNQAIDAISSTDFDAKEDVGLSDTAMTMSTNATRAVLNHGLHLNSSQSETVLEAEKTRSHSPERVKSLRGYHNSFDTSTEELVPGSKRDDDDDPVSLSKDTIVVVNKSDLVLSEDEGMLPTREDLGVEVCCLSCTTTNGMDDFISILAQRVKKLCGDPLAGSPSLTQSRHRTHLSRCLDHLQTSLAYSGHDDVVLAAQALRRAMCELGRVTGAVNVEDVLDVIFKDFCIGK